MMTMTRSSGNNLQTLCSPKQRESVSTAAAYFTFIFCAVVVFQQFSHGDYSAVLTLGAGVQTLGFFLLLLKTKQHKSVAGLSSKTLEMYVLVFIFRLASTLFFDGYLPLDSSGDFVYQIADIASFMLVLQLLYCVHKTHRHTYLVEHDTLEIWRAVPACGILALAFHGNLNNSLFFDVSWTFSTYVDTIAMFPQLWMLTKIGGEVDGMTSHFVASLVISRMCAFAFWFYGYEEIAPEEGVNMAGWLLITAIAVQVLASADFMFYYARAAVQGSKMVLPVAV